MCGIAGFLGPDALNRDDAFRAVRAMTDAIAHRGPDDEGVWVETETGVALGHRRLSILDLSPAGHQPMQSACGRYVVVFNGEIYNFRELRAELVSAGHRFRGHSDTEVLLAAVSEWGVRRAVERFNGMFAFALWDCGERLLHLARDRGGEKPLYYGRAGRTWIFGSELKALRAYPSFDMPIDRDAVALFLRFGYVPAPYSIYRGIRKLAAGMLLTLRPGDGDATPLAYWSARDAAERGAADRFQGSEQEALDELDDLLRDAVKLRMEADVPLGAFLSGGVDSSTIVALMQAQSTRPVRTFTIGFHEPKFNEAEHARAVAVHLGTDHTELTVTPKEAMDVVPRLPTLYDEPFADPSQIPTFLVSQLTRRHVTVSLSGDAGDELFAGYRRYRTGRGLWRRVGAIPHPARRAAAAALGILPRTGVPNATIAALTGRWTGKRSLGERLRQVAEILPVDSAAKLYEYQMSYWKDPAAVALGATEPVSAFAGMDAWRVDGQIEQMMGLDLVTYLPDDILVKVDRASMGVSLEARVPFLDTRVIEFAWRMPMSLKIRGGEGKWLLRQLLYRYVPRQLVERPKKGFDVPVGEWLRGPLRQWAEALLEEPRLRREGMLDPEPVRAKWAAHLSGRTSWDYDLWAVLMFQAWLETVAPSGAPRGTTRPRRPLAAVAT